MEMAFVELTSRGSRSWLEWFCLPPPKSPNRLAITSARDTQLDANKIAIFNKNSNGFFLLLARPDLRYLRRKKTFRFHLHQCRYVTLTFASLPEFFISCSIERVTFATPNLARIFRIFRLISSRTRINFRNFANSSTKSN
jgi:hypothetical protein